MKDKSPIPDHAIFAEGSYAWFHFKLIGKNFIDTKGQKLSKLDVFIEHRKSISTLHRIIAGTFKELKSVDKPGWNDGILTDRRSYSRNANGELILI